MNKLDKNTIKDMREIIKDYGDHPFVFSYNKEDLDFFGIFGNLLDVSIYMDNIDMTREYKDERHYFNFLTKEDAEIYITKINILLEFLAHSDTRLSYGVLRELIEKYKNFATIEDIKDE